MKEKDLLRAAVLYYFLYCKEDIVGFGDVQEFVEELSRSRFFRVYFSREQLSQIVKEAIRKINQTQVEKVTKYKHGRIVVEYMIRRKNRESELRGTYWDLLESLGWDLRGVRKTDLVQYYMPKWEKMGKPRFLLGLLWRIANNYQPIVFITGEPRTGKTSSAISLAERIFDSFDVDVHYFASILDFSQALWERKFRREALVIDEAEGDLSADEWASEFNKAFNVILSSQAYHNNVYFVISPHIRQIAKKHRYFGNYIIKMLDRGLARVYRLTSDWADLEGNVYRTVVDPYVVIPRPSRENWEKFTKIEEIVKDRILAAQIGELIPQKQEKQQSVLEVLRTLSQV